jgi:hypothetical protein
MQSKHPVDVDPAMADPDVMLTPSLPERIARRSSRLTAVPSCSAHSGSPVTSRIFDHAAIGIFLEASCPDNFPLTPCRNSVA